MLNPLRIIILVGTFPQLSETFIFRKAVTLAERGHHVTVAARRKGDWLLFQESLPLPPTLKIRYLPPDNNLSTPLNSIRAAKNCAEYFLRSPALTYSLLQTCFKQNYNHYQAFRQFLRHVPFLGLQTDIIHLEFSGLGSMYPLLPQVLSSPLILSCRGSDINLLEQRQESEIAAYLTGLRNASAIHCVSDKIASKVSLLMGRQEGIFVNKPAIDLESISPKNNYLTDKHPLILSTGRLEWIKGFDYLLAAYRILKQHGIPFRAQIIGGGSLYASLRFSIVDLGLKDEVELTGPLPPTEVIRRLRQADIFVLSSHQEGISNAVLEAMASGLPIVTTNAGGMAEVVRNDTDGFVVPIRDIPSMADRLSLLLLDANLRERLGRSARLRVEAEFSLKRQADVFERMYHSILAKKND